MYTFLITFLSIICVKGLYMESDFSNQFHRIIENKEQ